MQAGLGAGQYAIVAVALAAGLLTLFSMTKIWAEAFWKPAPADPALDSPAPDLGPRERYTLLLPIGLLAVLTVTIGLAAGPVFTLATRAAEQLVNRDAYVHAVLGGPR